MTNEFEASSALFGANSVFVEELYARYLQNPASVDASWQQFFASVGDSVANAKKQVEGASWAPRASGVIGKKDEEATAAKPDGKGKQAPVVISKEVLETASHDSVRVLQMIHAYRVRGHLLADLDPLGLEAPKAHPELDPATYGFAEGDYDRPIFIDGVLGLKTATLREILSILHATYCGKMGVEFMHIQYPEQKQWIQRRMEAARGKPDLTAEEKKAVLNTLIEVESFEQFLQLKYPGTKRFSVQGGDSMVPGLEVIIRTAASKGVEEILIGMPHRGRMNVLATIMKKPYAEMFSLFHGNMDFPEWVDSSGDVKYHLGTSSDRSFEGERKVHLSLTPNPSHLEAVNPVVVGKARAKMDQINDENRNRVLPILLHGDAAFAGQGSVAETLSLAELRGYRTGGTVHIIVNNQIGFTTSPIYSRFTPYPSDMAKAVQAPIFHVNGDEPEAVAYVCKLAAEFRQEFGRDVVVDIFCYRKYGHNESDEPMFTQPKMYKAIAKHLPPSTLYANALVASGVLTQGDVDAEFKRQREFFDEQYNVAKDFKPNKADWLEGQWAGLEKVKGEHPEVDTGVDVKLLKEVGEKLTSAPQGFNLNAKIARQLDTKKKMFDTGEGFDWATAEALAFGTLVKEKKVVRLSGQDCGRGTFSQRHAVFVDQETEERYIPLANIEPNQSKFEVVDSSLSEFAILGFEYGYTLSEPNALVLWEGQFGDFANGAQVIIDQFIASGEIKWLRMSGLVMLLPHGYEGQGPEHSSARLERFLQLCGEDNMQVVNCTTPANYYHVLRRQLHRKFRKPLIIMTPKSLLRHKLCVSTLSDMAKGTSFKRVIAETEKLVADDKIKQVVLCSGKVYYDLYEERHKRGINDVAIIRVEQLYPFPDKLIKAEFARYKNADVVWCQEEPENMGAWRFIGPKLGEVLEGLGRSDLRIRYAGRGEAASPAVGYLKIHEKQQQALVDSALTVASIAANANKKVSGVK